MAGWRPQFVDVDCLRCHLAWPLHAMATVHWYDGRAGQKWSRGGDPPAYSCPIDNAGCSRLPTSQHTHRVCHDALVL